MASLTNEVLLARHLVRMAPEPAAQAHMLNRALDVFHEYFFGLGMVTELQVEVHRMAEAGESLTYETITATNTQIWRKWHGDAVEVTPDGCGASWCEGSRHLQNFYGYQYLTGLAAGVAFADAIESEGQSAVARYLRFLAVGSAQRPAEALAESGVDLRATGPWRRALAQYAAWQDGLEKTFAIRP